MRLIRHVLSKDDKGKWQKLVLIPVNDDDNPPYAIVEEFDYAMLSHLGCSDYWSLNRYGEAMVWGSKRKQRIFVKRLIVDAGPGQRVAFINANRLDLRRSNLVISFSDRAKYRDRDYIRPMRQDRKSKVQHVVEHDREYIIQ
jgi:hypothetical protein